MNDYTAPTLTHRQIQIVFGSLMLGMLLAALDQTVLATALPTIVGEFSGIDHLSWVITSYLLTSTATVPLYGKLSDLYGRKLLFQISIVTFVIGSMLSGAAQSLDQLIIFRGLQGIGAGGIMTLAMAIVGDILPPRERGRYMGYFGIVFASSSIMGPLLGGLFVDHLSWRWVFYINVPLGVLSVFVASKVLKMKPAKRKVQIDFLGAGLIAAAVSCILLATTWGGNEHAWDSPTIVGLFGGGVLLFALFVLQESRAPEPILPLSLFRNRVFSTGNSITMIVGITMFGATAFLPLYMQVVKGVSATESGLHMLPMSFGAVTMSWFSGRMITQTGRYKIFPIVGTSLLAAGMFMMSRIGENTSFLLISVQLAMLGCGMGLMMQVVVLAIQNAVDYKDMGAATASTGFFRSMGGAFGVAIFGAVLTNRLNHFLPKYLTPEELASVDTSQLRASPEVLRSLPADIHSGVIEAFAHSIDTIFLVAAPLALVALLMAIRLPELPLRSRAPQPKQADPGAASAGPEAERIPAVAAMVD
ncbi:MAG: MDR family MFS transporter [Dehalococcoidia bacterium]